jgi:CBS domain-containing protein
MLISVVTDGSELANYSVVKTLNSTAKSWNARLLVFFISPRDSEFFEDYKKRLKDRAKARNVEINFEAIRSSRNDQVAKSICKIAGSSGVTGIFVPESLSQLEEELKAQCSDIPIEEVSSELFPSIWDVMTKRVTTININDTLEDAAELMTKNKIGSLIVMDRGRIGGILTEHDFVKACASGGNTKKVKDAMSKPVITLDRSGSIFEACGLMKKHQIKKLVIMNGEQLEGVVTTSDLARLPLNISEGLNHLVSKLRELSL